MSNDVKEVKSTATEKDAKGIEKVETVEMTASKVAEKQELPTTEEEIVLTEKQKGVILAAVEERRFLQQRTQEAFKREGDLVSLVIDAAGFDNEKVAEAKISEDGNSLILKVLDTLEVIE